MRNVAIPLSQERDRGQPARYPHPTDEELSLGTPNPGQPWFVVWTHFPWGLGQPASGAAVECQNLPILGRLRFECRMFVCLLYHCLNLR